MHSIMCMQVDEHSNRALHLLDLFNIQIVVHHPQSTNFWIIVHHSEFGPSSTIQIKQHPVSHLLDSHPTSGSLSYIRINLHPDHQHLDCCPTSGSTNIRIVIHHPDHHLPSGFWIIDINNGLEKKSRLVIQFIIDTRSVRLI